MYTIVTYLDGKSLGPASSRFMRTEDDVKNVLYLIAKDNTGGGRLQYAVELGGKPHWTVEEVQCIVAGKILEKMIEQTCQTKERDGEKPSSNF